MQLLVDNRSDSIKMHGSTIRFIFKLKMYFYVFDALMPFYIIYLVQAVSVHFVVWQVAKHFLSAEYITEAKRLATYAKWCNTRMPTVYLFIWLPFQRC